MDPDVDSLSSYTPVHAGNLTGDMGHPQVPAPSDAGLERKLDEALGLLHGLAHSVDEMRRELAAHRQ